MDSEKSSTCIQTAQTHTKKKIVLLLLSGGKDSRQALSRLIIEGWMVHALCIDGKQGVEKLGAIQAANEFGVKLDVVQITFFDETTWNPFKLISRDLAMAYWALRKAKQYSAHTVATGVKRSDIENPKLWWLSGFLKAIGWIASIFGLKLIHPAWEET